MTQNFATTFLISEVLRRQIELEQLVRSGNVDDGIVQGTLKEITDLIAEEATNKKNPTIANRSLRDKED